MNMVNLDMPQATIEIFSGFICLMIASIIMMNGQERRTWKILLRIFVVIAFLFFSEAGTYILQGNTETSDVVLNKICNFLLFFLYLVLLNLFIKYMYSLLQDKGVRPSGIFKRIVDICIFLDLVILFSNLFTGWIYYFDRANQYVRGAGWYVYTAITVISMLASGVMSVKYRRSVSRLMLMSLLFYVIVPIIAIVFQALFFGYSITNIGVSIAMVVILLAYLREWEKTPESKARDRKSIEIVVLFFIMMISMSAAVVSSIISIKKISVQNSENNSMMVAHMINATIDNEFLRPIVVAETMANDYSLKQYLQTDGVFGTAQVEDKVTAYLNSIRTGFGYQMVYAVSDATKAFYTYNGFVKYLDIDNDEDDIWYKHFIDSNRTSELSVDTDEASSWDLSVFVDREIRDEEGNLLGVCGVGLEMTKLQQLLMQYEKTYHVHVNLVDENGLILVDTDSRKIKNAYIDRSWLAAANTPEFSYMQMDHSSVMVRYIEQYGWYLVVEDQMPDKINVVHLISSSVIILFIGLLMMGIVFAIIYIRERKAERELAEKKRMSVTDEMTGLFNRRAYEEDCARLVDQNQLVEMTIIMMDVNGLKVANDTKGHMVGDELIIAAANCMQNTMGEYGRVYRIGGDEFVALIRCTKQQLDEMLKTFEHLEDRWKDMNQEELSVSKGVVVVKECESLTLDELRDLADHRMYEEKDAYYRRTNKERRKK